MQRSKEQNWFTSRDIKLAMLIVGPKECAERYFINCGLTISTIQLVDKACPNMVNLARTHRSNVKKLRIGTESFGLLKLFNQVANLYMFINPTVDPVQLSGLSLPNLKSLSMCMCSDDIAPMLAILSACANLSILDLNVYLVEVLPTAARCCTLSAAMRWMMQICCC